MKKNYTFLKLAIITAFLFFSTSNAQIIANGTYNIYNPNLSEVISVNRIAMGDPGNPQNVIIGRARMQAYNINNDDQKWTFTHQGNDVYKITNVGDNSILGVKDGWCGDFGDVQVGFDNTSPYTLFKVVNGATANTYVFQIAFDGDCNFGSTNSPIKAFDIDGGNSGSKINTFPISSGNANQEFQILDPATLSTNSFNNSTKFEVYYSALNGLNITNKEGFSTNLNVKIYDITGKQIKNQIANSNNTNSLQMNVNDLTKGVYLVHVTENNSNSVHKIIIY